MATARVSGKTESAFCPACGAAVKLALPVRSRRVQCPKCRKVVVLDPPAEPQVLPGESRIAALEARVEALEKALAAATASPAGRSKLKLKWVNDEPPVIFSAAQAEVLRHNLSAIGVHRITIQSPTGDEDARGRAEWFKAVFERAQWPVLGPEDAPATMTHGGLALATCLPVSPEAAATYLALRAAGFDLVTAFDPDLSGREERLIVA